jgi:hypothetical protein
MSEKDEWTSAEDATAQDVIDALRLALMAQNDAEEGFKLVKELLELAPETANDRGIKLLIELIAEGSLRVEMAG